MIYKGVEFHNVACFLKDDGREGKRWCRVPENVRDTLELGMAEKVASAYTGVELRFVLKGDSVTFKFTKQYPGDGWLYCMHVYYGGIQGTWADHEINRHIEGDGCDITIKKPENLERLKAMAKASNDVWDPEVIRVIFDTGYYRVVDIIGDVEPPKPEQCPQKTLLTYGSSITHGSNSLDSSHAWTSLLAWHLKADLRNLGMSGSCALEPAMMDYIAELGENGKWDVATLAFGINVLDWNDEKIIDRVTNAITVVASRNPDKNIYVISPIYWYGDFEGKPEAQNWRNHVKAICEKLNFKNVTYIDGLSLVDNISYMSADEVHPNIYGVQKIYEELKKVVKL